MRFFTRQLYNSLQISENLDGIWQPAEDAYARYLDDVRASLPKDIAWIAEPYEFHDSKIRENDVVGDGSLRLVFRDRNAHAQPTREVVLTFEGVFASSDMSDTNGRWILYCELFVQQSGQYQFSVLLDEGEMSIDFTSVAIEVYELDRTGVRKRGHQ